MSEIKSLADQLRGHVSDSEKKKPPDIPEILLRIRDYDNRDHKCLSHIRFNTQTIQTMNHFKMATGVDVTRLVAFAVAELFDKHPELKTLIKQFIQQIDL